MKRFLSGVITGLVLPVWLIISLFNPTNWLEDIAPKQGESKFGYNLGIALGLTVWLFLAVSLIAGNI